MTDTTELAERLLEAHVAHAVAELTGAGAATLVAEEVDAALGAVGHVTVGALLDRDATVATVRAVVDHVGASGAVALLVEGLVPALYGLPAAGDHILGAVVPEEAVAEIVDTLARSRGLREELLRRVGRSPAIQVLAMRFVSALVGDAVQQNRKRAEKLPGAKLALGVGDMAARSARGLAPKQLEKVVGSAADKSAQAALERVSRALLDTLDEDAVRAAGVELWELHAADLLAGLRAYLSEDEVLAVAVQLHRIVDHARTTPISDAVIEAVVDGFLERHGAQTLDELLTTLGLSHAAVAEEVRRHVPTVVAALDADGTLAALVRRRLEPFHRSDELRALLADVLG